MQDFKARIEKLRADADDCELIAQLATAPAKRLAFKNLAQMFRDIAKDLERYIEDGKEIG